MGYALRRQLATRGPAVLADLAAQLPPGDLPRAEAIARTMPDPDGRARVLLAIRDRTGSASLDDEILAAARQAGDTRSELLMAWAQGADAAARGPVLVEACAAADRWTRAGTLAGAVGLAPPAILGTLLDEASRLPQEGIVPVLQALDRRAADVDPATRDRALILARAPRARRPRDERLAAVIHLLDSPDRDALVRDAMDRADDAEVGDPVVVAAAPSWPAEARLRTAQRWLLDDEGAYDPAGLLDVLGPADRRALFERLVRLPARRVPPASMQLLLSGLPDDARPAAIREVERRYRGSRRVEALVALTAGNEAALRGALEAVDGPAADTWTAVLVGLREELPRSLAQAAVETARRASDPRLRLRALAVLAPLTDDPLRAAVVDEVVEGIPLAAGVMEWDDWSGLALAASPDQARAAVAAIRATMRGWRADDAIVMLAAALDDDGLVDLVETAARARPTLAVTLLASYAPSLSGAARARAVAVTSLIRDPGRRATARAHVLAAVAAQPDGAPSDGAPATDPGATPEATLDLAITAGDEPASEVLSLLHEQLPPRRALDAAMSIGGSGYRFTALTAIRPSLPRPLRHSADNELRTLAEQGFAGGMGAGGGGDGGLGGAGGADASEALGALFPASAVEGSPPGPLAGFAPGPLEGFAPPGPLEGGAASPLAGFAPGLLEGFAPPSPLEGFAPSPLQAFAPVAGIAAPGPAAPAPAPSAHVAYGLLDAPAEVVSGAPFVLEVGLSREPARGVAGPPIAFPALSDTPYLVDVRIAAPGFDFAPGESQRRSLVLDLAHPYPTTTVALLAKAAPDGPVGRPITAEFWVNGERLGDAVRYLMVLPDPRLRRLPEGERVQAGINVPAPSGGEVPDLTITVRLSDPPGDTAWTFDSPHDAVVPNPAPVGRPLGDAAGFLRDGIEQVDDAEGTDGVFGDVLGLANRVSERIPDEVWAAIRAAAGAAGGPPTILLQCEEAYVPWELAHVEPPLRPGTTLPPFLAAQARIARWVLATSTVDGRTRPPTIPPRDKTVGKVGVVSGSYHGTGWSDLIHATQEAREIKRRFKGLRILPTNRAMFDLLKGTPAVDLLHFAVHGRYNPLDAGGQSGIILTDGNSLHANEIAARDLATHPVVFLNACQVGAGQLELGAYSGIAAAFVEAGASAVVAPLWKVDDLIAMQLALDFYDRIARGEPLSEVLREAREPFADSADTLSATWMAYQLFAHPSFTVAGLAKVQPGLAKGRPHAAEPPAPAVDGPPVPAVAGPGPG